MEASNRSGIPPVVSVVIPYGGLQLQFLGNQLAAIDRQASNFAIEVIVSVNVRSELAQVRDLVRKLALDYIQVVDSSDSQGPSYARNVGWRASNAEIILFCDADDEVAGSWLAGMIRASAESEVFGGPLNYTALNAGLNPALRKKQNGPSIKWGYLPFFSSCNLGTKRCILEAVGGWDTNLRTAEDTDFCWRAIYHGARVGFESSALVHYRLRTNWRDAWAQSRNYGWGDAELMAKHRAYGARRSLRALPRELAGLLLISVRAMLDNDYRMAAVSRWAYLVGRIDGSARLRVWVI